MTRWLRDLALLLGLFAPAVLGQGAGDLGEWLEGGSDGPPPPATSLLWALRDGLVEDRALLPAERAQVLEHLVTCPGSEVRAALRADLVSWSTDSARADALHLLGALGEAADLPALFDLSAFADDLATLEPKLSLAVERILGRDGRAYPRLYSYLRRATPEILPAVVEGVRAAGSPRALPALANLLGSGRELDKHVLRALRDLAARAVPPVKPEVLDAVRPYLGEQEGELLCAALAVSGHLQDHEAIPEMIEALERPDAAVRTAARRALQELSGLAFPGDARRWDAWHRSERDWWRERAPETLQGVRHGDLAGVTAALGEIVTRRLFRDDLALELVPLLESSDVEMRRLVCEGLAQLGSGAAAADLVLRLEDVDEAVRAAALAALQQITGRRLPPDPAEWRASLEEEHP